MQLTHLKAFLSLTGDGTASRPGITWTPRLGNVAAQDWDQADKVLYSFTLTGISTSINPSLNLLDGTVFADGAIVAGAGTDFEGNPLPVMEGVLAILLERLDTESVLVQVADPGSGMTAWHLAPGNSMLQITSRTSSPELGDGQPSELVFSAFSDPDLETLVRVTVLALRDIGA